MSAVIVEEGAVVGRVGLLKGLIGGRNACLGKGRAFIFVDSGRSWYAGGEENTQ